MKEKQSTKGLTRMKKSPKEEKKRSWEWQKIKNIKTSATNKAQTKESIDWLSIVFLLLSVKNTKIWETKNFWGLSHADFVCFFAPQMNQNKECFKHH